MNIDEILDNIEELLDRSWSLPLSGGRCVVDADKVRDLVDDIRLNLPSEIKQARGIVADRSEIIDNAKREAEQIYRYVPLWREQLPSGEHLLSLYALCSGLRYDRIYLTRGEELPPTDLLWRQEQA